VDTNTEVTRFLQAIGVGQYAAEFAAQGITSLAVVGSLNDADYKDLGVPIGHKFTIRQELTKQAANSP
jgi:hypothetical protein